MFFKLVMPPVAALLVVSALLVSCSTSPSTSTTSSQTTPSATTGTTTTPQAKATAATAPTASKPSGSLTFAYIFPPGAMDPIKSDTSYFQYHLSPVFDSLVELTPEGDARPGIAERWEISRDGKAHTFFIRKGVKFHNGDSLTGADVKFSLERFLAPGSTHTDVIALRNQVESVALKDDYTVVLNLKQPQFEILQGFPSRSGIASVMPKKYIEEKGADYFGTHPIGSGPFKVTSFQAGNKIAYEANEEHWRVVPQFKTITFISLSDAPTIIAQLKTGELDIATVSPDSAENLKAAGIRIYQHDGGSQTQWNVFIDRDNPKNNPLGDVRARKALSLATNRGEVAKSLYRGNAQPGVLLYGRTSATYWDANVLKPDPFDPEGAKKLMAEAGYANGFSMTIFDIGLGMGPQLAQVLQAYWRKVGIDAAIQPIEYAAWAGLTSTKPSNPKAWNTIIAAETSGGAFQFEKMPYLYHSVKGRNWNINNQKLDELIDKIPLTTDPAEKKKLMLQAAVMARDEYTSPAITDNFTLYALSSKIGNVAPIKGIAAPGSMLESLTRAK